MTCTEILATIDALPPAEWQPVQREAVERHIRDCRACRDALETARMLASALGNLP